VADAFFLLRSASRQLSLEPDEQRRSFAGMVVNDELALDLENAVASVRFAQDAAGSTLAAEVVDELQDLLRLLTAPPEDRLWEDRALDDDERWAKARAVARRVLPDLPSA
jgi:hypothetical protein